MPKYNFVYEVTSSSNPNKKYIIKMRDDGLLTCNCPSWIYKTRGGRTCKHVDIILRAGFEADERGKFITGTDNYGHKVPVFCKKYGQEAGCEACSLRFRCYTDKAPEFDRQELANNGIGVRNAFP